MEMSIAIIGLIICYSFGMIASPALMQLSMIVFSWGHFYGGFYAQFKTGKMPLWKLAALIALWLGIFFLIKWEFKIFEILVIVWFLVHFYFDEFFLMDREPQKFEVAAFALVISAILLCYFKIQMAISTHTLIMAGFFALIYLARTASPWHTLVGFAALTLTWNSNPWAGFMAADGFVILLHYYRWYQMTLKKTNIPRLTSTEFVLRFVLANVGSVYVLLNWREFAPTLFGQVFLSTPSFYAWSLIHFVSRMRPIRFAIAK